MKKKIRRALVSVSDKSKLIKILPTLKKFKIEILSSGGTYKYIRKHKLKSIEISDFTDFKEILDGRVKTLHPKIHAGILFRRDKKKTFRSNQKTKNTKYRSCDCKLLSF